MNTGDDWFRQETFTAARREVEPHCIPESVANVRFRQRYFTPRKVIFQLLSKLADERAGVFELVPYSMPHTDVSSVVVRDIALAAQTCPTLKTKAVTPPGIPYLATQ
jgi:hypothetical protein